jgi:hypothetical protein
MLRQYRPSVSRREGAAGAVGQWAKMEISTLMDATELPPIPPLMPPPPPMLSIASSQSDRLVVACGGTCLLAPSM